MTTLNGIEFHRSHFTGEPRATCTHCGKVWAHWQNADDLEHDCRYKPGAGTPPIVDLPRFTIA